MFGKIIRECIVCKQPGVKSTDHDEYDDETLPIVKCVGTSVNCCHEYIWVHITNQSNSNHNFDCESRIKEIRNDANKKGLCVVCNKRLYYNNVEKSIMVLLIGFGVYSVGWKVMLIGSSVVFVVGGICSLLGGYYMFRNVIIDQ